MLLLQFLGKMFNVSSKHGVFGGLQREYKKALEQEIKGKGMLALATDTPDFMRARNATDILSQVC